MEWTPVDWPTVFADEDPDRTAVILTAQRAHCLRDKNLAADFKRCGAVETIRYERYRGWHYAIIQFDDAASATNLLRKTSIFLRGVDFIVQPFHSIGNLLNNIQCMNFNHRSFSAAPGNSNENILNSLNDDCLTEVFRRIHSMSDVFAIVDVCVHFRRIGENAFASLLKRKQVDLSELKAGGSVTLMDVDKFLCRFGPSIVSVVLDEEDFQNMTDVVNPMLKLMQKHCANLKSLTLCKNIKFKELEKKTVIEIRPLLSELSHVEIWHTARFPFASENYVDLILACASVETLIVNTNFDELNFPKVHFPKLKVFQSHDNYGKYGGFLAKNEQIEQLDIPWESETGRLIAENIPTIREVFLRRLSFHSDITHLKTLQHANISIQAIALDDQRFEVLYDMENITSLRLLVLGSFDYDKFRELTRRLSNLKNLALYIGGGRNWRSLSKDMLKGILQHANKLAKLKVKMPSNYTCNVHVNDYNEILQVVKARSISLKLHVVLDSTTRRYDGEHGIKTSQLNFDPQWLTITRRYEYFTRKFRSTCDDFERRAEKSTGLGTHVSLSLLPTFDIFPSKVDKIKHNVL